MRYLPVLSSSLLLALPLPLAACENAAFEKLQNLAGRWLVHRDGEVIGKAHVQREAGDCVLLEKWQSADGTDAVTMHWTEPGETTEEGEAKKTRVLRQTFVDNSGWVMHADATVENDAIVYEGETTIEGKDVVLRATLHGLGSDEIVQIGDVSKDGGKTWQRMDSMTWRRIE